MFYLGVDPGETIGVAWWNPATEGWRAWQTKSPDEAMRWLEEIVTTVTGQYEITVEKYTGGGYKTKAGTYTSELVGWFSNHFSYVHGKTVRRPNSQQRLSAMDQVERLIAGTDTPGPHSHDALAHAIVHSRMDVQ